MNRKKQLIVLLAALVWSSVSAAWIEWHRGWSYPAGTIGRIVVAILPAVLLAGILFWWFGKQPESQASSGSSEDRPYPKLSEDEKQRVMDNVRRIQQIEQAKPTSKKVQ